MSEPEVRLQKLTRREFREALAEGRIQAAIVAIGSTEQHLEHLPMEHDMASCTYVATEVAKRLYPGVIVAAPVAMGISEHHMMHKGTLSAKPGSLLAVLFDAVESLVRHGIKNILVLNGHGGNVPPFQGAINQWRRYFAATAPGVNLHFFSYWDFTPRELANEILDTDRLPGHAQEFETSFALAIFPEGVRRAALEDQKDSEALLATAEKGKKLAETTIAQVAEFVKGMLEGRNRSELTGL